MVKVYKINRKQKELNICQLGLELCCLIDNPSRYDAAPTHVTQLTRKFARPRPTSPDLTFSVWLGVAGCGWAWLCVGVAGRGWATSFSAERTSRYFENHRTVMWPLPLPALPTIPALPTTHGLLPLPPPLVMLVLVVMVLLRMLVMVLVELWSRLVRFRSRLSC